MPVARLNFGSAQESGTDELSGSSPIALNAVIDAAGAVRRRPGIQAYAGAPSSVIDSSGLAAIHETQTGVLYAVAASAYVKPVYVLCAGSASNITGTALGAGGQRIVTAETEAMVVFADGGPPIKHVFGTPLTSYLGGVPPNATHVIANSSRLLADSVADPNTVFFSGTAAGSSVAGHETWSGITAGDFSAEARPDAVVALHENTNEVFLFGRSSLQVFAPDASTVYTAVTANEYGCSAPYSIIKKDQAFAWLDQRRRFVVSDGRQAQVLSDQIQQTLNDMTTVSDCFGYRVHTGPVDALVWTFPTDGRTFAYYGSGWAQWSQHAGGAIATFPVLSHFQRAVGAENLVGTTTGHVRVLRSGVADDLGTPITAAVTTGFLANGTMARKKTRGLSVALRRGETTTGGTVGLLRYRDNLGPWSNAIPVYVGSPGDTDPVITLGSVGWTYRMRQWRFEFSAGVTYTLVGIHEEYEVLAS